MRPCLSSDGLRDHHQPDCCQSDRVPHRQKQSHAKTKTVAFLTVLAASLPVSMAQQNCVSLRGSTTCPAFSGASINTALTGDLYVHLNALPSLVANSCASAPSYHSSKMCNLLTTAYATTSQRPMRKDSQFIRLLGLANRVETNTVQISEYLGVLERQSDQHHRTLCPIHHDRLVQRNSTEFQTVVWIEWLKCDTALRWCLCTFYHVTEYHFSDAT